MVAPYEGHDRQLLHLTIAPWMIGSFVDVLTQGVLVCQVRPALQCSTGSVERAMQFNNYFNWYRDDKTWLRFAVGGLLFLTTLKVLDSWCVAG